MKTLVLPSMILLLLILFATACVGGDGELAGGEELYLSRGCSACHTQDGMTGIGPTFKGLYGSQVELEDGSTVTADDGYLIESILEPNAKIVKGYFSGSMPTGGLTEREALQLAAFIKTAR